MYLYGLKKGIPIAIGYLAVSFSFGVMTGELGITPLMATIISLTNVTSSGQFAGVRMIAKAASYIEIFLTVLLINLRYMLMSISLSQKIDSNIPMWQRLLFGFGITDEVFAVAAMENKKITASYMFGLITLPIMGWTLGTALGAYSSSIFPPRLLEALGIALYAMFMAIIIPDAKRSKAVLIVILISSAISCALYYIPVINKIGIGFKIIISTAISALIGALLFPIAQKEELEDV